MSLVLGLADMESQIISERSTDAIETARINGRMVGRPKLDTKTIERIKYLYRSSGYTLREIAEDCQVSLGTVHKYIPKIHSGK